MPENVLVPAVGGAGLPNGPLAHMLALMVMIYIGAATSGAHFNPAVSLAMLVTGNQQFMECLLYIAFQCAGGLAAGFMVWFICMYSDAAAKHPLGYVNTYPHVVMMAIGNVSEGAFGPSFWKCMLGEFLGTFFLVFMVFATVMDRVNVKKGGFGSAYGICIGGVVGMSAFGLKLSGGCLNPARWLGPWIVSLMAVPAVEKTFHNPLGFIVYSVACSGGGVVGGIMYKALFLPKD